MTVFQLINEVQMIDLEYYHFENPNELIEVGIHH